MYKRKLMSKNISLKSIVDFENGNINFYIPSYQRGYGWKNRHASQLIDDKNAYTPTKSAPFYFPQALAVANVTKYEENFCTRQR